jgi:hypothetical protein
VSGEAFAWVDRQLAGSEKALFDHTGGCRLCHQELTHPERRPAGLPQLARPNVPARWFAHARFSHKSHEALASGCAECHKGVNESRTAQDVLLPRLEDCRGCHNPATGVRSDCAGCHGYHKPSPGS